MRIHYFFGHFFFVCKTYAMVIASRSDYNVSLLHSPALPGGEPCTQDVLRKIMGTFLNLFGAG